MPVFEHVFGTDQQGGQMISHSGQQCEIVRQLSDAECDPECQPMYRIRFSDGFETDAFAEEIGL